ncbi:(+)-alpha-terpineol synthase-like [Rhodamnia argentea]|uniref:(+)-alpha-terpineol synthase-like n=1 Tax=Rhodamnia argentea TaxID=178133 RepID=A0ABM3GSR1_9MYRT|nr:(+)-alpha-terpineol synthase-like [Rhodamnia argentea]
MALPALFTSFLPSSTRHSQPSPSFFRHPRSSFPSSASSGARSVTCSSIVKDQEIVRRSANWKPNMWDYGFLQSLSVDCTEDNYTEQVQRFKEDVEGLFDREMNQVAKFEFIDAVQRLGLGYHFEMEIKNALSSIDNAIEDAQVLNGLYTASLRFRLLGQHGYNVPQDVFRKFMNKTGTFDESLSMDVNGLLGLYEASFHGLEGETILDEARNFASKHLKDLNLDKLPAILASHVSHALDMPIHWRPNRLEARWFMDMYEKQQDMIPSLLRLAKLDFNLVQSVHKKEVSNMARWWVDLGANKMTFFRDRLVEHYFWNCAMVFEPQYTTYREMTTKLTCMVTLIDDVYDVYGTLEELELLTNFIVRWDITDIDKLPPIIRDSYMALYNTTNEIGYWTMRELGINTIPYMRKVWADECEAYIKEARWYNKGIKPTMKEYINNAVDSIGGLIMLLGSYFLTTDELMEEGLDYVSNIPSVMHCSAKILRLNNDLSTSSYELARGDNFKALECFMNETSASEEAAREHIRHLVHETWKRMNKGMFEDYPFPGFGPFLGACLNLARASQCFYQYGDGHGLPDHETKKHLVSALFEPVPLD